MCLPTENGAPVLNRPVAELVPAFVGRVPVGGAVPWVFHDARYSLGRSGRATGVILLELETGVGDFRTMRFPFPVR
jgi:hypothetical protein